MNRITKKDLEAQVEELNDDLIESLHHKLSWAYGGVKLMKPQPRGGEVDALYSGYLTKRDLYTHIDAYCRGMLLC